MIDITSSTAARLPKISVVMPSFNSSRYIESAILSIINQKYPNFELIVMDGGSNDGTLEILKRYDHHITYWESEADRGQTHALNKGFKRATGDLFSWLNSDEEYLPNTFNKVSKAYLINEDISLIFGGRILLDLTTHPTQSTIQLQPSISPFKLILYTGRILFTDATFWTKSTHRKTGELNELEYSRYAMDVDWLLRISSNSKKWVKIDEPLSIFKLHGQNVTIEGDLLGKRYNEKIRRDYAITHQISKFKLFIFWLYYSTLLRYIEFGLKGLLVPPKFSTVWYLFFKNIKN